jgi:hypothetical protein
MVQKPKELDLHFLSSAKIFPSKILWVERNVIRFDSKNGQERRKVSTLEVVLMATCS